MSKLRQGDLRRIRYAKQNLLSKNLAKIVIFARVWILSNGVEDTPLLQLILTSFYQVVSIFFSETLDFFYKQLVYKQQYLIL